MLITAIIVIGAAIGLLRLLFKLLKKPMKLGFKLALHAVFGYVFLFIFNFVGAWADLSIELNWLNAIITGIFGIPGVAVMLIIKYLL